MGGANENIHVTLMRTHYFTNFSMNVYSLSDNWDQNMDSDKQSEHEVQVYRFWCYENERSSVPSETVYFNKLLNVINFNNPVYKRTPGFGRPLTSRRDTNRVVNYLVNSE